jgi:pentatricopeptide repeat protein
MFFLFWSIIFIFTTKGFFARIIGWLFLQLFFSNFYSFCAENFPFRIHFICQKDFCVIVTPTLLGVHACLPNWGFFFFCLNIICNFSCFSFPVVEIILVSCLLLWLLQLFDWMQRHNKISASSYSSYIKFMGTSLNPAKALEIYHSIPDESTKTNVFICNSLLRCLVRNTKFDSSMKFFHKMKNNGLTPDAITYSTVCKIWSAI